MTKKKKKLHEKYMTGTRQITLVYKVFVFEIYYFILFIASIPKIHWINYCILSADSVFFYKIWFKKNYYFWFCYFRVFTTFNIDNVLQVSLFLGTELAVSSAFLFSQWEGAHMKITFLFLWASFHKWFRIWHQLILNFVWLLWWTCNLLRLLGQYL